MNKLIREIRERPVDIDEDTGKPIMVDHTWQTLAVCLHFAKHEIRWNEVKMAPEACHADHIDDNGGWGDWRTLDDHTTHCIRAEIASKCLIQQARGKPKPMKWTKPDWDDAMHRLAEVTPSNPPRLYLLGKAQDAEDMTDQEAEDHLTHVLRDALGVDMSNPLHAWAAKAMWIGVVQRVMEPGTSQRIIPVLMGAQDCGKSSFIRHMLPKQLAEYHQPNVSLFGDYDEFVHSTMGMVLGECPELVGSRKADAQAFKAKVGIGEDYVRLKYGRHAMRVKRTMYLLGTANREQALPRDVTGTTRFVVVDCQGPGPKVIGAHRTVAIRREPCWTAACRLYFHAANKFDPAFLPSKLRPAQHEANKAHVPVNDAIDALIAEYVKDTFMGEKNVKEIAIGAGVIEEGREISNMTIGDVKQALTNAGCREVRRKVGKSMVRLWAPPKEEPKVVRLHGEALPDEQE